MSALNPYTLFSQGKITHAQYIRMIKRELHIIKMNNVYRVGNEKAHTDTGSIWAKQTEEFNL